MSLIRELLEASFFRIGKQALTPELLELGQKELRKVLVNLSSASPWKFEDMGNGGRWDYLPGVSFFRADNPEDKFQSISAGLVEWRDRPMILVETTFLRPFNTTAFGGKSPKFVENVGAVMKEKYKLDHPSNVAGARHRQSVGAKAAKDLQDRMTIHEWQVKL